ncbi:hypothetical protein DOY81_010277, partial [Sarcophaga bullata]
SQLRFGKLTEFKFSIWAHWSELKAWLLRIQAKLIRYLVLSSARIIVIVQLYQCFSKLDNPPISRILIIMLNETIEMPAVTVCRDPPYKSEGLTNISGNSCEHPKYSSCWSNFPYGEVDLTEFFMNSTFNESETFAENQYGLNGLIENLEITSDIHFNMGRCHTIRPKISLKRANRVSGYSIMLKHHLTHEEIQTRYFENPPGWHIFIHDMRENFTEINMKASGRVEYVFADINEEIEIKLQSQYFSNVETKYVSCSRKEGYSDLKESILFCGEVCIWQDLAKRTNCSGPWMDYVHQPFCSSYKSMLKLIGEYGKVYDSDDDVDCECIQPCISRIFSAYIQNRKSFVYPEPNTQVWIYYTTKLISQMIEERPSYDTTQFIADVGGSLGFLLGLSVLGLIGIITCKMHFKLC